MTALPSRGSFVETLRCTCLKLVISTTFFWPSTVWYALQAEENEAKSVECHLLAVVMLYVATELPSLMAVCEDGELDNYRQLLTRMRPFLPTRFHAHISPPLEDVLRQSSYTLELHGRCDKMVLATQDALKRPSTVQVHRLTTKDLSAAEKLYSEAYPGNWFEQRMLETGLYFAVRRADGGQQQQELLCIAGVHVFSKHHRVAVLGNVTTHPDHRHKGLASAAVAAVCRALLEEKVDTIGLNVHADNAQAIACYQRLGFQRIASYGEWMCWRT